MTPGTELELLLSKYGVSLDGGPARQFRTYLELLQKWNRRINLVSSTSWNIIGPLFEESLWASQFYPRETVRHLDIGSGAGFPALPLRILNPGMRLGLVESRAKRAIFLETAAEALNLDAIKVFHCTLEEFLKDQGSQGNWDCFSWKAIRLDRKCLSSLVHCARPGTAFWMFHGEKLPIEGGEPDPLMELVRSETMPRKPSWRLSIFERRPA